MDANQPTDVGLSSPATAQGAAIPTAQVAAVAVPPTMPLAQLHDQDEQAADEVSIPEDDDSGAIDQEWVEKAKDIVERTKGDPFAESRELSKAKASYLKTRYNKDLKVAEDAGQ